MIIHVIQFEFIVRWLKVVQDQINFSFLNLNQYFCQVFFQYMIFKQLNDRQFEFKFLDIFFYFLKQLDSMVMNEIKI